MENNRDYKPVRLLAAAKEFNIGQDIMVNFLVSRGFNRDDLKPTAKISEAMYLALQDEFGTAMYEKEKQDFYFSHMALVDKINECIDTKNPRLDIGNFGLTDKDFEENRYLNELITRCGHLKFLNLSARMYNPDIRLYQLSENSYKENYLGRIPTCLFHLEELEQLFVCGSEKVKWDIYDLSFVNEFKKLIQVDVSYNRVSTFTDVRSKSIQILNLQGNIISNISDDNELDSLKFLNLSINRLKQVFGINKFKRLERLFLNDNKLEESVGLYGLVNLKELDLSNNELKKIEGLTTLRQLEILNLNGNSLARIEGLESLQALEELYLDNNFFTSIEGVGHLENLRILDANNNQINNLENLDDELGHITTLGTLNLSGNQITSLHGIENFYSLRILGIAYNQIEDITPIINLKELNDVYFDKNKFLDDIPEEVIDVGWEAIRDRALFGRLVDFKEVKVLLLGNPNVGKSNLLEFLETNREPKKDETTHGIQYLRLNRKQNNVTVHCWDFGGQEYFHATHQLFFSRGALYIVLWSKENKQRDENNKEDCFDLSYWLRCIEQLIPLDTKENIDVVVVENKIDLNDNIPTVLNQEKYVEKYKKLSFNFLNFSLKPLARVNGFKELFKEKIQTLWKKHPDEYLKYYRIIQNSANNFIEINDISVKNSDSVKTAMSVFHNMGLLLYFKDIIPNKVFIKPQSLLDLLYQNILGKEKKSALKINDIENAIDKNEFGLNTKEIIELLKEFDLVFQISESSDVYFVPQYLQAPPTIIDFFEQYQFSRENIYIESDNFLMNVAMLKLFSNFGKYVRGKENEFLFWKDGIIIEKQNSLLLIKLDRKNQRIKLYQDIKGENFDLQKEIVDFILKISTKKVQPDSMTSESLLESNTDINWHSNNFDVFVSIDNTYFAKWKDLSDNIQEGIYQIKVYSLKDDLHSQKSKTVSVFDFNKYIPNNNKGKMKKIFISYSKEDLRLVNKFIDHLSALKLDGKIATWYCTELTAGSEWNSEIQDHFDNSDIVCFMVSSNFMRTKYIQEYEVKKAFERKLKDPTFKIVPIILDYCNWRTTKNNLGDFTALPYSAKPVTDFNNQNIAWFVIEQCLRIVIDVDSNVTDDDLYSNPTLSEEVKKIFVRIKEERINNDVL